MRTQLWHSPTPDRRGDVITSLLQGSDHVVLNQNTYTRTPSQISQQLTSPDITSISSNLVNQTTWKATTALSSDHLPIIITINTKNNFRLAPCNKTFTNYNKTNWSKFTEEIELNLQDVPTPDNVHSANKYLTNLILLADKHHIPKGRIKKLNQPLSEHITDLLNARNILRKNTPFDPHIPFLNKDITKLINIHRTDQWKAKLEQIGDHKKNSHTLWNTINYLSDKKPPSHPNTIITFNDKLALTPKQKAIAFNKQFVNVV